MKSTTKKSILIVFLLMLFIGPLILAPSLMAPVKQNTIKDFVPSSSSWLDGWDYRKAINITGSAGAGANYQIDLIVDWIPNMEYDFDDIRFTDNDGKTLLDYWLEDFTAHSMIPYEEGIAYFWIEVKDNLDTTKIIYMYYGNAAVSTTSNGMNTFIFYEDWATETVIAAKWDTITSDGSISFDDTDADHGSVIKIEGNAGTDVYELRTDSTTTAPTSIIGRLKIESTVAASQRTVWGMGSMVAAPLVLLRSIEGSEDFLALDDGSVSDSAAVAAGYFDSYEHLMITRDGTNAKLWKDYILGYTISCEPDTVANVVINLYVRDTEYDLYCDWTAQRKYVSPEPAFDSWGDEEEKPPSAIWVEVSDVTLYFSVSYDMWGYNTGLIILGLIMIPVSTIYLAYGIKHDRSSDRLFYGLIIFMVGCGLFIGGILP